MVNTAALAAMIGVSRTQIGFYVEQGMPKAGIGEFHAPSCIAWLLSRKASTRRSDTGETVFDQLHRAQRELVELQVEQKRATLLPRELASEALQRVAAAIGEEVDLIADCAAELAALDDPGVIQQRLFEISRETRRKIAARLRELGTGIQRGE